MATVPSKHSRDFPQDFEGLLGNLQDWELSLKDKDKKLRLDAAGKGTLDRPGHPSRSNTSDSARVNAKQYDYLKEYEALGQLSSGASSQESLVDANSEKELGNEFFKQKKFNEAIDCYSRSIALSPTAIAYGNRAMAYIKIKKDLLKKAIWSIDTLCGGSHEAGKIGGGTKKQACGLRFWKIVPRGNNNLGEVVADTSMEIKRNRMKSNGSDAGSGSETTKIVSKNNKQELRASVQELAAKAAGLAKAEAAKNIVPPNSAYQFETFWRGLSGDRELQARLLKVTSPAALPGIFKNALSAPILVDMIRCIATFFMQDMTLGIEYLKNLTKIPRFDILIMCLASADKADITKTWDEVFSKASTEYAAILSNLRSRYGVKQR
ncbi:hypothetical protein PHJA_000178900 [Phtheirospermum japonicum]|uniref:RNA-polymerase II-associated protein 3-like C-terminal domain-containing protein n=1 Tax=Phtheirospermum japonicum TaxID=374723 RepID=A0A830B8C1_9LAMI|nr:hypothetical protein PHJA_000178900 [Phtheirospermum japonicum]